MRIKDFFSLCRLLPHKIKMYVRTTDGSIYEVKDINKVKIDEWSTPGATYQVRGAVIELGDKYQRPSMSEFNKG